MTRMIPGLAAALLLPLAAAAASQDGKFKADGAGTAPCSDFTAALEAGDRVKVAGFAAWTEGFLTAVNALQADTYDITPWQTTPVLMEKLRRFCLGHPGTQMIEATGQLAAVLAPYRQVAESPMVQARNSGRAVMLPAVILERVRQVLEEERGSGLSTAGGDFDAAFSAALAGFQKARGLAETGLPDQLTLNMMFP
ncbi:peptidoglycan-binding domain-containing protein [Mangrovicoccus ximenensis]|uniref:peptidoglycan-binding domain-containing protein n=1 Tax=Mangrovicoccus ximenensis TaxID=1911570 RepID=UPI00191C51C0|nr:peptidoglycan-binding domain-containing protein [Mangrovicoccus ximenensis]